MRLRRHLLRRRCLARRRNAIGAGLAPLGRQAKASDEDAYRRPRRFFVVRSGVARMGCDHLPARGRIPPQRQVLCHSWIDGGWVPLLACPAVPKTRVDKPTRGTPQATSDIAIVTRMARGFLAWAWRGRWLLRSNNSSLISPSSA